MTHIHNHHKSSGVMVTGKTGEPIEGAIAEACAMYRARFGVAPEVVRVNVTNPASIEAPDGVELSFVGYVPPGAAWACGPAAEVER